MKASEFISYVAEPNCKKAILNVAYEWLTYNQICDRLSHYPYNYGTVERNVRWLVEEGKLENKVERIKFSNKTKLFKKFKAKEQV